MLLFTNVVISPRGEMNSHFEYDLFYQTLKKSVQSVNAVTYMHARNVTFSYSLTAKSISFVCVIRRRVKSVL